MKVNVKGLENNEIILWGTEGKEKKNGICKLHPQVS